VQGTVRLFAFSLATIIVQPLFGVDHTGREPGPFTTSVNRQPADAVATEDVASVLRSLSSPRYRDRAAALEHLQLVARQSRSIGRVYPALKAAAADEALTVDVRLMLGPLLETARYTWLASASTDDKTPSPPMENITRCLQTIVSTSEGDTLQTTVRRESAEWELLDMLARGARASTVQQCIETALAREELDHDAMVRLRRLAEWSRPGLAAEYWQRRRNLSVQYFVLGMPAKAPGAVRATQFDRVVADIAQCVSGNSLAPGEYPLNVAFPHPREQAAFFQLVSLPTARDRLAYQYESDRLGDGERLQAITERTLAPSLVNRRPLDEGQMWLLGHLDQAAVARLMRVYFAEVPDEPHDLSQLAPMLTDVSSCHRAACIMLALDGSHEVVPMLVEAAEKKQFLNLDTDEPQALPWIAALAIAAREPWEEVDVWLAGLIDRVDRISFGVGAQGDVGATAAAMLLKRNGEEPADFELIAREPLRRGLHDRFEAPVNADYRQRMFEDRMFKQLGVAPYYFANANARTAMQAWWNQRQSVPASPSSPKLAPPATFTARAVRP